MARPVVIVGAGISGLAAAFDLKKAGVECIVFDKRPRPGGVIETHTWDNCLLDCGPDSFISAKPEAMTLIKDVGLENEIIGSNDHQRTTFIVKNGRLVALPEGIMMMVPTRIWPMVKTPLLSWGTKIRMAGELLRKPVKNPDRSVADFVVDHFGQETLDYLAEPLLSGIYGGDPSQLSVISTLPRFVDMEAREGSLSRAVMKMKTQSAKSGQAPPLFRSLKRGLGALVEKLACGLRIEQGSVEAISSTGVRVNGNTVEASDVIVAAPAWSAAELVRATDSELAGLLATIPYSSSAILSLIYNESEFDGKRAGFGFLVPKPERRRLAAATFVNTKFPHRAPDSRIVLRCFLGGMGDIGVLDETDESVVKIARGELQRILGLTAAPVYHAVTRWPKSMAQYTVGHGDRIAKIKQRAAGIPWLQLAGNGYEGIGIPDCIRTGRSAAEAIIQRLA